MKKFALILCTLFILCLCGCEKPADAVPAGDFDTAYFALSIPEGWTGKFKHTVENFDDGSYAVTIYQRDGLQDFSREEICTVRLFDQEEITSEYHLSHGTLIGKRQEFIIRARLPENTPSRDADVAAYDLAAEKAFAILKTLTPKDGWKVQRPQLEAGSEIFAVIDTKYYTLTLPEDWIETCVVDLSQDGDEGNTLSIYEAKSYKANGSGHLFSIILVPTNEDYTFYPSYELLASLDTPEGSFYAVAIFPTDVQFSVDTAAVYQEMEAQVKDTLYSISAKDGIEMSMP